MVTEYSVFVATVNGIRIFCMVEELSGHLDGVSNQYPPPKSGKSVRSGKCILSLTSQRGQLSIHKGKCSCSGDVGSQQLIKWRALRNITVMIKFHLLMLFYSFLDFFGAILSSWAAGHCLCVSWKCYDPLPPFYLLCQLGEVAPSLPELRWKFI